MRSTFLSFQPPAVGEEDVAARVDGERAGATHDDDQRALTEEKLGTSIHFLPVHTRDAYRDRLASEMPVVRDAIDAPRRVHERFAR